MEQALVKILPYVVPGIAVLFFVSSFTGVSLKW